MIGFSIMMWFCSAVIIILAISLLRGNYSSMHGTVFDNTEDKESYAKAVGKPTLFMGMGIAAVGTSAIIIQDFCPIIVSVVLLPVLLLSLITVSAIWFARIQKAFKEISRYSDAMISDFTDPLFQTAFRQYFTELGYRIRDWDSLFREMKDEGDNAAFVRTADDGRTIGFIFFRPIRFSSCFFEETYGFIREFWIAGEFRNKGHGTALIGLAEKHFRDSGIFTSILTTNTAADFYEKRGYERAPGCRAKNQHEVFVKRLT